MKKSNAVAKANVVSIVQPSVVAVAENVKVQKPSNKAVAKSAKGSAELKAIFDRPFGTEGHSFGDAIEHQASVYKSLVKQRKGQLEKLKGIGEVLIELRSVIGKSDKEFGQAVKATPLNIMSRQDRSDAMWLAENWTEVQTFTKEMDISSASAAYLRQKIAKAKKSPSTEGSAKSTAKGSDQDSAEGSDEATVEASTQDSDEVTESATLDVDSEESFAASIKLIATQQGLDLAKVIAVLIKG
jgi:hypothetical protein